MKGKGIMSLPGDPPFLQAVLQTQTASNKGCKGCTAAVHLWTPHHVWHGCYLMASGEEWYNDLLYSNLTAFCLWL